MSTHTRSAGRAEETAVASSYHPGVGRRRDAEMERLDRQAGLTFENEFALLIGGGLTETGTIVDLGSGNGAITTRLRERRAGATVIGVDVDPELLASVPAPTLLIEEGRIPLGDGTVDDVLVRFVAQHLTPEDRSSLWAETLRILAPGGRVHVIDVDDTDAGITRPPQPALGYVFSKVHAGQAAEGGDRRVIGKIAAELESAGFTAAHQVRDGVTSQERPIADFAVHLGPERLLPYVAAGILTLGDLAISTKSWHAVRDAPDAYVCIYIHVVRAHKPGPTSTAAVLTEGDTP